MNLLYSFLHFLVKITLPLYYRRVHVSGIENLPNDKPVLLAVNHQNAFLDAVLVVYQLNRQAYFLARSDVFKNRVVGKILRKLNIVPIYRSQDGTGVKNNGEVFNWCYHTLSENKWVLIFPEGTCEPQQHMYPLKKGMARIALGAVEKYPDLDLQIVPVGLNYSEHMGFRSDVWIDYGTPISVRDIALCDKGSGEKINALTAAVEFELRKVVLHHEMEGYAEAAEAMRHNIAALRPQSGRTLVDIKKSALSSEKSFSAKPNFWRELFSFPLLLVHRPLYFAIDAMAAKLTGMDAFFPSVKYGLCALLFPFYWLFLSLFLTYMLQVPTLLVFPIWLLFPVSLWAGLKIKKV